MNPRSFACGGCENRYGGFAQKVRRRGGHGVPPLQELPHSQASCRFFVGVALRGHPSVGLFVEGSLRLTWRIRLRIEPFRNRRQDEDGARSFSYLECWR